ncbi:MAG TPA: 3-methyl-2-oxobutanoate hydroxymethyltransferase [Tepidisphaeraceae bacterium]|nr:3-methyl-2-oxobutanoate hydroxymethyltransferase [Tepidisphaeraceae bacterium]
MSTPPRSPDKRFTLADLRAARAAGTKVPVLTCYDYTTAKLMQDAGVPALLVGDSAANVILGHPTTLPVTLEFMIEIAAAVRRGAPNCFVVADMPFGSYAEPGDAGVANVVRMVKLSGCDCVKLETAAGHAPLVRQLTDAGVAVMAHLGLKPQSVAVMGGYRFQGRTAADAAEIVEAAELLEGAGAVALLLEAVPPEVGRAVVEAVGVPVIGCGAGPACHGFVVVTHDLANLTDRRPKFAPLVGDLAGPTKAVAAEYARQVVAGEYPAAEHNYEMPAEEKRRFLEPRR